MRDTSNKGTGMMAWWLVIALCGAGPADEVGAALADLTSRVEPHARPATRYVSLYNVPPQQRDDVAATLSFVVNSVSRSETIVCPQPVPGSQRRLWRLSLDDYALPAESWEALAAGDPYWHLQTEVVPPGANKNQRQTVFTDGGWIDLAEAAALRAHSHSAGALLRADYVIERSTTTLDGGLYYQLANIAERETDFLKEIGIDAATILRLRADAGANLIRSQVTFKMRRVVRRPSPLGGAWHTYDVARSTAERDPIRNPLAFEYDASEHIAPGPNGLLRYALYDRQGRRQDTVPDVIAKDTSDVHGSGIVVPMLSCVRCHVEDGLRPVANDQRVLVERHVELFVEQADTARRLAKFYLSDLDKLMARDRADYADAVAQATGGRTPREVATLLADVVRDYVDRLVTLDVAARELGVEQEALLRHVADSNDPVLLSLAAGLSVQRQQWEAAFSEAALRIAAGQRAAQTGASR